MNKITRLLALLLLVVMTISMVSCDKIPLINDLLGKPDVTPDGGNAEHTHSYVDGKCECGEILYSTIKDLTDNYSGTELFYVKATVKKVLDETTGEMIIADADGEITVKALVDENGVSYAELAKKPDKADEVVLQCALQKKSGVITVKNAILVSFTAVDAPLDIITIAEALEIGAANTNETERLYYIRGTVTKVSNPAYGEMYITDGTNEILVYNTKNADGTVGYADMTERPVKGDEVLLFCTLNNHNGTSQVKSAWVIEFTHTPVVIDPSMYIEATIAEAREAEADALLKVKGVVAQITYANGYKPSGVILVDDTSSIYVYDGDLAGQVSVGNTIEVAGTKAYWILETEISSANKFGYKGACQLDSAILISNDKGNSEFNKSWITETTVKEIMDTPVTENITNKIFKATALVKRVDGTGFINYYIDDIDGITGSYVYTQCNGGDFAWLDQFDGKFCTVYFVAINAKSSTSGCVWRFLPISVSDDGYVFNTDNAAEYAVKYHGLTGFLTSYTGDPAIVLETVVDSELLGFEGATLSYASSNEAVVYFTNEDGVVTFHGGVAGTATVTVTGSYNGKTYSQSVDVTIEENAEVEYITVAEAIATPKDTDVIVKGIVGPSLVNRDGFYLFGEDGSMIAVIISKSAFEGLAIGNEIVVSGMRERFIKDDSYTTYGQDAIVDGVIVANYYGNHEYSTEKFITGKTLADIKALSVNESHSTEVYVVKATVEVVETDYYTNLKITHNGVELPLYCSGANQYSWLKQYAGQEITMEIAPCNWNDKKDNYRGCVLAVVLEDGTKILNTLNFQ